MEGLQSLLNGVIQQWTHRQHCIARPHIPKSRNPLSIVNLSKHSEVFLGTAPIH